MIHFITGRPGGGKSYFALRQILQELKISRRYIVTNLSLNVGELAAYLQENDCCDGDLSVRLRILDDVESRQFWLYQGPGCLHQKRVKIESGNHTASYPDFSDRQPVGTLYVIDEVHVHFPAREWMKTGTDCTYYLSQHRKLGDDVLLITQNPEQVDKGLRRLAQDFTVLRNLGNEKIAGFTMRGYLRRATYLFPKSKGDHQPPQETGLVKLDVSGLCKLYDTNAGVGVVGRVDAKKESRVKGLPVWSAPLILLLILGGCYLGLKGVIKGFQSGVTHMVGGTKEKTKEWVSNVSGLGTNGPAGKPSTPAATPAARPGGSVVRVIDPRNAGVSTNVFVVGAAQWSGTLNVILSDGRLIDGRDVRQWNGTELVLRDGSRFQWESPSDRRQRTKPVDVSRSWTVPTLGAYVPH